MIENLKLNKVEESIDETGDFIITTIFVLGDGEINEEVYKTKDVKLVTFLLNIFKHLKQIERTEDVDFDEDLIDILKRDSLKNAVNFYISRFRWVHHDLYEDIIDDLFFSILTYDDLVDSIILANNMKVVFNVHDEKYLVEL